MTSQNSLTISFATIYHFLSNQPISVPLQSNFQKSVLTSCLLISVLFRFISHFIRNHKPQSDPSIYPSASQSTNPTLFSLCYVRWINNHSIVCFMAILLCLLVLFEAAKHQSCMTPRNVLCFLFIAFYSSELQCSCQQRIGRFVIVSFGKTMFCEISFRSLGTLSGQHQPRRAWRLRSRDESMRKVHVVYIKHHLWSSETESAVVRDLPRSKLN